MKRFLCLMAFLVLTVSLPAYSKDKNPSLENAIEDVLDGDEHPGKGQGRPDNPGEHGRENAAEKQSRGHGKGSKSDGSWVDEIKDDIEDDDKSKRSEKNKKN